MSANNILFPSTNLFHYYQSPKQHHGGVLHRVVRQQWEEGQAENYNESAAAITAEEQQNRKGRGARRRSQLVTPTGAKLSGDGR